MNEFPAIQAYLNGRFLPASTAAISLVNTGFVQGATVGEQLRTFAGELFHLESHLLRLAHSLAIVGIDPGLSRDEMARAAQIGRSQSSALGCR